MLIHSLILLQIKKSNGQITEFEAELPIKGVTQKEINQWEAMTLPEQESSISSIDYSPDGKVLVSAQSSYDSGNNKYFSEIIFWNVQDIRKPVEIVKIKEWDSYVKSVCFSPDGKTLAAVYGKDTKRKYLNLKHNGYNAVLFEGEVKLLDVSELSQIKEIFCNRANGFYATTVDFFFC